MNRIYKLVWSDVNRCFVAVSELARSSGKGRSAKRIRQILASGLLTGAILLPAGTALSFSSSTPIDSSSYYYNAPPGVDYMSNGGAGILYRDGGSTHIDVNVDINGNTTWEYNNAWITHEPDFSNRFGNVAIGNYATSGKLVDVEVYQTPVKAAIENADGSTTEKWYYSVYKVGGKYYGYDYDPSTYNYVYATIKDDWSDYATDENGNRIVLTAEEMNSLIDSVVQSSDSPTNNVAIGNKSLTANHSSVAVGDSSRVYGYAGVAIGARAEVGKETPSGDWDNGTASVAIGNDSKAYGSTSVALGNGSRTDSFSGIALGNYASANTEFSIAVGDNAQVAYVNGADNNEAKLVAVHGIAIGRDSLVEGKDAVAVGRQSQALMRNATAYGNNSHANGWNTVAVGNKAIAGSQSATDRGESAVAVGNRATATDEFTTALGSSTYADGFHSVAVGDSNRATGRFSTAVGSGWSLYTVNEEENDNTEGKRTYEAIGANQAAGDYSTAVGYGNTTTGVRSHAFGMQNQVSGPDSLAAGTDNKIGTVAFSGNENESLLADSQDSTLTGYAFGSMNRLTGSSDTYAGAYGHANEVASNNSYAIGNENTTSEEAERSFVVGHIATATVADAVALGSYSAAKRGRANGGGGAGYDVTTGTNYAGDGADSPTWVSTLGAVSVGGDSSDGSIGGRAAEQTRQITGVAAGTADTDAVNVAQLKLARAGVVQPGENVTIVENKEGDVYNYTINGSEVLKGDYIQSVVKGERDVDESDPTKGKITTFTVNGMKTELISSDNSVEIIGGDTADEKGIFTYDLKVKGGVGGNINITSNDETVVINKDGDTYDLSVVGGKDTITNIEAGDNVTVENISKEGDTNITYKVSAKDTKIKNVTADYSTVNDNSNKGKLTVTDTEGNTFTTDVQNTYTVKAETNPKDHTVTFTRNDGGTYQINNIATMDDINNIRGDINHLDNKIEKVGAGAAALAGLHPLDFDPDEKWDFAASVGSYKSEQAVALGAFYRPNEDTMFSIGGTIGNGNNMVNVGVSWKFGQKNRISANRISSAKEIIELRKNQEDVHSFLADAVAGNQLDLSKIQLFPDVEENHWAYDYVATMAGNGVLEGYPDGYFKGNRNMTRYEMAAVLYRMMQNGARLSDRALTEFAPELDRIRVDTITHHKDGTPHIQRVRTIKERVDEKATKDTKKEKKAKIKVAETPVE